MMNGLLEASDVVLRVLSVARVLRLLAGVMTPGVSIVEGRARRVGRISSARHCSELTAVLTVLTRMGYRPDGVGHRSRASSDDE